MAVKNPVDYLCSYIDRNFPNLTDRFVTTTGDGAEAYCLHKSGVIFRLYIPVEAPANARPLCNEVRKNLVLTANDVKERWRRAKKVWSFREDTQQFVDLSQKVRIHLHSLHGVLMLVHVEEGKPDKLYRISRINDNNFPDQVEVLSKANIAQLWGFRPVFEEREKRILAEMRKRSTRV